jgi:hypothetical protein
VYVFGEVMPLGEVVQKVDVESLYIEFLELAVSDGLHPEDSRHFAAPTEPPIHPSAAGSRRRSPRGASRSTADNLQGPVLVGSTAPTTQRRRLGSSVLVVAEGATSHHPLHREGVVASGVGSRPVFPLHTVCTLTCQDIPGVQSAGALSGAPGGIGAFGACHTSSSSPLCRVGAAPGVLTGVSVVRQIHLDATCPGRLARFRLEARNSMTGADQGTL